MNLNRIVNAFGTVDSVPFAPRAKLIAPALGAAAITAGGNVLSNVLGGIFNSNANKQNIALQRETNAQNYKMFKEQQQFNIDMWNKQNEYNTPQAQVQRLLAAGINPQAFFGSGQANVAGQIQSPNAPTAQAPHVNPFQPDLNTGDAVNAYYQSQLMTAQKRKINAETQHTELANQFDYESLADRLKSLREMAKRDDYLGQIARTQLSYEQDSYYWRLKSLRNDISLQYDQMNQNKENIMAARLQNDLHKIQIAYAPKLNDAQLKQYYTSVAQINAQIGLINANRMLTDAQRINEIEKKTGIIIENGMKGLDYNLQKAVQKYVIQDYENNSQLLQNDVRDYEANWWNNTIKGYIPFASGAAVGLSTQFKPRPVRIKGF